ncbi:MAG: hypothetical protein H6Q89_5170 [Myxococcaceae bacterium]|nr:hypothetical protein [Myxococcaceae bacterium]
MPTELRPISGASWVFVALTSGAHGFAESAGRCPWNRTAALVLRPTKIVSVEMPPTVRRARVIALAMVSNEPIPQPTAVAAARPVAATRLWIWAPAAVRVGR